MCLLRDVQVVLFSRLKQICVLHRQSLTAKQRSPKSSWKALTAHTWASLEICVHVRTYVCQDASVCVVCVCVWDRGRDRQMFLMFREKLCRLNFFCRGYHGPYTIFSSTTDFGYIITGTSSALFEWFHRGSDKVFRTVSAVHVRSAASVGKVNNRWSFSSQQSFISIFFQSWSMNE